jgi:M6 family metalloprotease-like protein
VFSYRIIYKKLDMRRMIYVLAITFAFFVCLPSAFAIKAIPYPLTITQPDGSSLTIRLHGDEFGHFRTTEDGFKIKKNNKGYFVYDLKNSTSVDKTTEIIARDASKRSPTEMRILQAIKASNEDLSGNVVPNKRSKTFGIQRITKVQRAFPIIGTPKSLVILVNFSNKSYIVPTPKTAFTNLLNQSGYTDNGATGSARDYFMSASYGKFAPQFDVVGPYTLPQNMAYYGANDSNGDDQNPQQLVIDACTLANNAGLDFSQYDVDNDGFVDNVFIYYAGYNEAEDVQEIMPNLIWPHRWSLANYNTKFDGKTVFDYACTSELNGTSGSTMCGIGTFCHEFGHVLGLPDYYHTEADKNTLNEWHIMDSGAYNNQGRTPPTYSVYDRFFLGWLTPEQIDTPNDYSLLPIYQGTTQPVNTNQQAYLLSATTHNLDGDNPSPTEFFMIEYRKKTGWDYYLPSEGMFIWHIDYDATAWNDNTPNNYTGTSQTASSHMRVYLQPLSGSTTTPGTAFTTGSFTPNTWSGTNINRPISDIVKTADNVTFKLMGGAPIDPSAPHIKTGIIESLLTFTATNVNSTKAKTLNIKTTDLLGNLTIAVTGTHAAMFKTSSTSIIKEASNNISGINITISYEPTAIGQHTATLTISGGGLNPAKVITLNGEGK